MKTHFQTNENQFPNLNLNFKGSNKYLKGPIRKLKRDFLQGHAVTGQGGMALN